MLDTVGQLDKLDGADSVSIDVELLDYLYSKDALLNQGSEEVYIRVSVPIRSW